MLFILLSFGTCIVILRACDSGVKLSLKKTRVKKKQVEMMIGQNIITRTSHTASVMLHTHVSDVNLLC